MTNGEKFEAVFGFGADGSRVIAVNSSWWDCDFQGIRKPKTNGDQIRNMSDEEFSNFLFGIQCASASRPKEWLDWLKEEADK